MKLSERTILDEILAVSHSIGAPQLPAVPEQADDPWVGGGDHIPADDLVLLSPGAHSNLSQGSVGSPTPFMHAHPGTFGSQVELAEEDLIVEKMHIHHGMKGNNPVSRLRFFPKHSGENAVGM